MRELMSFAPAIGAGVLAIVSAYHTLTLAWSVGTQAWFLVLMGGGSLAFWTLAAGLLWHWTRCELAERREMMRRDSWARGTRGGGIPGGRTGGR